MLSWLIRKLRLLRWPQQSLPLHRFYLHLSPAKLMRPGLTRPVPLSARTRLEILLVQGKNPIPLLEAGFMRLKDRKTLVLRYPGLGQTLHLQYSGLELAASMGYGEVLAPYVRTAEGLLYYEQPFVFEPELASVAVPVRPWPKTLQGRAQPLGGPTVSRRFRP